MKYYIVRENKEKNRKEYYKNKCVEDWTTKKEICWQFSKQGAKAIANRLNEIEARKVYKHLEIVDGVWKGIEDTDQTRKVTYSIEQTE